MINGAHIVLYTNDPEADRAFFRDVLNLSSVDAGHGWLIFALPPAEAAFHDLEKQEHNGAALAAPTNYDPKGTAHHELFLMCDDLAATLRDLKSKHVPVSVVSEQRWGNVATLTLPGGSKLGIYQPKHSRPLQRER
jgi:catechol 2,3-dioxygenase-like lactoylglutathione lyase family enzyme